MMKAISRLAERIAHWAAGHTRRHCKGCEADTWHAWEAINPIHLDGPPFYFTYTCLVCDTCLHISSGIFEETAARMVEAGEMTEDQAADRLAMILPPKCLRDTYLQDEDE